MEQWLDLHISDEAHSYDRFSSKRQEQGASLDRQLKASRLVCERFGLRLNPIRFRDLGVSAYTGRNAISGALADVLAACDAGAIPPGRKLIVESLDRITRQDPYTAEGRIRDLCDRGLVIVTANDFQVYSKRRLAEDFGAGVILKAMLARAYEESKIKSDRVRDARERNRKALREGTGKLPRMLPGWLTSVDGKAVEIPDRVETLRLIFRLAADGLGSSTIAKQLNREGRPVFDRKGQGIRDERSASGWDADRIVQLIASEAPRGFYQPHTSNPTTGKREPTGEPIHCLPTIVDDRTWHLARIIHGPA
jgi:DNA invertase Pin-like site-specific DNA recombinase